MNQKQPSWEAIERAYRAGWLSLRAIMQPYAPDLTQRMLKELSPSPTPATGD